MWSVCLCVNAQVSGIVPPLGVVGGGADCERRGPHMYRCFALNRNREAILDAVTVWPGDHALTCDDRSARSCLQETPRRPPRAPPPQVPEFANGPCVVSACLGRTLVCIVMVVSAPPAPRRAPPCFKVVKMQGPFAKNAMLASCCLPLHPALAASCLFLAPLPSSLLLQK